jgi:coenzyme F420-dependent glucose-6-phosphate dehydrogenase
VTSFAWMCAHEAYQPEDLLQHAIRAESSGFDLVVAPDVFHPWVDDHSAAGFVWSWLGAVAARTTNLRMATTVTAPLFRYHPALIAQAAATVDRLSGGRFTLGVGTGIGIHEGPLGHELPGHRERLDRLREAVRIIRRLWSGERVTLEGRFYRTDRARLQSPPTGPIAIWMAADGPAAARVAGEIADGLVTSVKDVEYTRIRVLEPFTTAARARGADPLVVATRWCVLAETEDEAWRALAPLRGLRAPGREREIDPAVLRERADGLQRAEVLARFAVVGDAPDLVAAYRPLIEALGADVVSIQVATTRPAAAIDLVGSEVLPILRTLGQG